MEEPCKQNKLAISIQQITFSNSVIVLLLTSLAVNAMIGRQGKHCLKIVFSNVYVKYFDAF